MADPQQITVMLQDTLDKVNNGNIEASLLEAQALDFKNFASQFERGEDVNFVATAVFDAEGGVLPLIGLLAEENAKAKRKTLPKAIVKLLDFAGEVIVKLRGFGNKDLQHATTLIETCHRLA